MEYRSLVQKVFDVYRYCYIHSYITLEGVVSK